MANRFPTRWTVGIPMQRFDQEQFLPSSTTALCAGFQRVGSRLQYTQTASVYS